MPDGPNELRAERRAVVDHVPSLSSLTPGRTGNLSVRTGDRFAITPTGVAYDTIAVDDVSVVSLDGDHLCGLDPSSESAMHRGVYRAFDAGAVVHTHSPWATTLAVLHEPLPPVHYMVAFAGDHVPVAPYATYGSDALAANVVETLREAETDACLLANHGVVALGTDAGDAVETARAVETTARLYCQARTLGTPMALDDDELARVVGRFAGYGQHDGGGPDR